MDLVAQDLGGDWYFDGDKTYLCINREGKTIGKMFAEYIPDPMKLWESKCNAAGIDISSLAAKKLKSSEVVYKLWEHKCQL